MSTEFFLQLATVALIAISPVGEILVAMPIGVLLGVGPLLAFAVAYTSNLLPAVLLLFLFEHVERMFPSFFQYFVKQAHRFKRYISGPYGTVVFLAITPLIGVYAASLSTRLLGFSRASSIIVQSVSLFVYGVAEVVGLYFGIQLWHRL